MSISTSRTPTPGSHIPALDGFRGLAVLLVMLSHFLVIGGLVDAVRTQSPVHRLLQCGYLGVDMFFVLSGFLITGILIDAKGTERYFQTFFMRRVLRIFPAYYFALALAYLSVPFFSPWDSAQMSGVDHPAWFWAYASNIGVVVKGDWLHAPLWLNLGHFWSLAVEEQFYLVWPWLVYLLSRRKLMWLCLACLALGPGFQFLFHVLTHDSLAGYVSTPARLNTLGFGAFLAVAARDEELWPRILKWAPAVALGTGICLLGQVLFRQTGLFTTTATLCFGAFLVLALRQPRGAWHGFLESRAMRFLGKYSYGLYIYHHLFKPVWERFLWKGFLVPWLGEGWLAVAAYTVVAGAATVGISLLSWVLVETQFLKLKKYFEYRKDRKTKAAQVEPEPLAPEAV